MFGGLWLTALARTWSGCRCGTFRPLQLGRSGSGRLPLCHGWPAVSKALGDEVQARLDLAHVLARPFDEGAYLVQLFMCWPRTAKTVRPDTESARRDPDAVVGLEASHEGGLGQPAPAPLEH